MDDAPPRTRPFDPNDLDERQEEFADFNDDERELTEIFADEPEERRRRKARREEVPE